MNPTSHEIAQSMIAKYTKEILALKEKPKFEANDARRLRDASKLLAALHQIKQERK